MVKNRTISTSMPKVHAAALFFSKNGSPVSYIIFFKNQIVLERHLYLELNLDMYSNLQA
jgi:hypothetical protein